MFFFYTRKVTGAVVANTDQSLCSLPTVVTEKGADSTVVTQQVHLGLSPCKTLQSFVLQIIFPLRYFDGFSLFHVKCSQLQFFTFRIRLQSESNINSVSWCPVICPTCHWRQTLFTYWHYIKKCMLRRWVIGCIIMKEISGMAL